MVKKRVKDQVIGYTTGVFDLFHIGHLNILKKAKMNCDKLIVGVSTDELVSYKHKKPIICHKERMEIVRCIKYVDMVIPQTDRDKYKTWKRLKYDVLFVGDDWKGTDFFNDLEDKLRKVSVEVMYFPYTKGTSSTLINEILENLRFE